MQDFTQRPLIAIWETTQACDLACLHCRADARPTRDERELSTAEAKRMMLSLSQQGVPLLILTGGDPAKRPDLVELVEYGTKSGLKLALTPSTTPLVTPGLLQSLAAAGLSRVAVSIDGPDAPTHDGFRQVVGSFAAALDILRRARCLGLGLQVNTSVHAGNIDKILGMAPLMAELGVQLWSLFLVVPTGRAKGTVTLTAEDVERFLEDLAIVSEAARFGIKTTAAPQYRRILLERHQQKTASSYGPAGLRINEGRGFVFVSHRGEVMPSGFLPLACGNVRGDLSVVDIYREHPVFIGLRTEDAFAGKCGVCKFRKVCGGSRARAYANTGNPFESDPLCSYVPPEYVPPATRATVRLGVLQP